MFRLYARRRKRPCFFNSTYMHRDPLVSPGHALLPLERGFQGTGREKAVRLLREEVDATHGIKFGGLLKNLNTNSENEGQAVVVRISYGSSQIKLSAVQFKSTCFLVLQFLPARLAIHFCYFVCKNCKFKIFTQCPA